MARYSVCPLQLGTLDALEPFDDAAETRTTKARGVTAIAVRAAVVAVRTAGSVWQWTADPLMVGHQTARIAVRAVALTIGTQDAAHHP
jgi:hypothetical protein